MGNHEMGRESGSGKASRLELTAESRVGRVRAPSKCEFWQIQSRAILICFWLGMEAPRRSYMIVIGWARAKTSSSVPSIVRIPMSSIGFARARMTSRGTVSSGHCSSVTSLKPQSTGPSSVIMMAALFPGAPSGLDADGNVGTDAGGVGAEPDGTASEEGCV